MKNKTKQINELKEPCKEEKALQAFFMQRAILEARKSEKRGEVPVGAIIVLNGKIIATSGNLRERKNDATAHAEILAIKKACKKLKNFRLSNASIYITLMPCPMCAGAICASRIENVFYGAEGKESDKELILNILSSDSLNHKVKIEGGILQTECSQMLENFFRKKRLEKKLIKKNID